MLKILLIPDILKSSMHENHEPITPEKETNLSRRKFLKIAGMAVSGVLADKLIPKTSAEISETSSAVEVHGEGLPKFVQEAIKQNNRKHKDHAITPEDVSYILNWKKYIEANNDKITEKEKEKIAKDLAYFTDAPEPRVHVVGDSDFAHNLRQQSRHEGCGDLSQLVLNSAVIHEATHFHGGDELDAYTAQLKYLEEQEAVFKAMQSAGRYSHQFFVYLHSYITKYQEHLDGIKTGKYPKGFSKLR